MQRGLPDFARRRFDPAGRYGLRVTLFAFAMMLVAVPFGILLDQVIRKGSLVRSDASVAKNLHDAVSGHPLLIGFLKALTFIGTPLWFLVVITGVGIFLWKHGRIRLALFLVVTALMGGIIDSVVKILVNRPRPNLANPIIPLHGKSFPSGHSMTSTIVYGALLLIFFPVIQRRLRVWAIAGVVMLVLAIGASRLALGVHYVTDVLGGIVLGLAWLSTSTAAFSIWKQERGRTPVKPMSGLEPDASKDLKAGAG